MNSSKEQILKLIPAGDYIVATQDKLLKSRINTLQKSEAENLRTRVFLMENV